MDAINARPKLLKQANLSAVRRSVKARETATRAEISLETGISPTTVRALLTEMLQNGELESIGYDASSGGRKAQRYRLRPDRYHGAALCITDSQVHGLLVDICGNIVETVALKPADGDWRKAVHLYLDSLVSRKEIKSIGVGVPGAVEGGGFWRKDPDTGGLSEMQIGDALAKRYGVPVILENDLNAAAIGFGLRQNKGRSAGGLNLAYLNFERGCVSAGFLSEGRAIRGYRNFAGELGLIPLEPGRTLDDCMAEPLDDTQFVRCVVGLLGWICGVLNPQYAVLGGPDFRAGCIGPIRDGLSALLPKHLLAEILSTPGLWPDYHAGMAQLTSGKMFCEVQFTQA